MATKTKARAKSRPARTSLATHFWTALDNSKYQEHVSSTRAGAENPYGFDKRNPKTVRKIEFKPLAAAARFRAFVTDLHPDFEWDLGKGETYEERAAERQRASNEYQKLVAAMGQPEHLLDAHLVGCTAHGEWWTEPSDLMTRAAAVREVARINRENIVEYGLADWRHGWAIAVELAETLTGILSAWELDSSGIGHEDRNVTYPFRLLIPTEQEISKYGKLPTTGKAGAA